MANFDILRLLHKLHATEWVDSQASDLDLFFVCLAQLRSHAVVDSLDSFCRGLFRLALRLFLLLLSLQVEGKHPDRDCYQDPHQRIIQAV